MKKLLAGLALLTLSSMAQATLIGSSNSGADCTFPCMTRIQQVYDSSYFSETTSVSTINFFTTGTNHLNATYDLFVGYASGDYTDVGTNFSANIGASYQLFGSQVFSGSYTAGETISFSGVFEYDPTQGDLLIDIVRSNETGRNSGYMAAAGGLLISRSYEWPNGSQNAHSGYGISTEFLGGAINVSEPATLAMLGFGLLGLGVTRRKYSAK